MARIPGPDLQALLAEEPFVRSLARALASDDADEVVQQTWLQALQHGGAVGRPRSWLARIAHNVAANLRRSDRRRQQRERHAAARERVPSSAELMEREERRSALVRAVDQLPPPLRAAVLLRWFEGLPPRAIAAELGLPVTKVWNRLRSALQVLRERLDAEHRGDRAAWLLPLVQLAPASLAGLPRVGTTIPPAVPAVLAGVIAMTGKTKFAAAAVALLLAGTLALWWGSGTPTLPPAPPAAVTTAGLAAADLPTDAVPEPAPAGTSQRQVVLPAGPDAADRTGTLLVRAHRGSDRTPAAGETLVVLRKGADSLLDGLEVRTGASGEARIDGLAAGTVTVELLQNPQAVAAEITAGAVTELDFALPVGMDIRGHVVDADDRPVAGAEIVLADISSSYPRVVATTAADGSFELRDVYQASLVGARADGHAASRLQMPWMTVGAANAVELELVLLAGGGIVEGVVTDADGQPVAGAVVRAGSGELDGVVSSIGMPAVAVPVRTDADGRFRSTGIAAGEQPVIVRASGLAPWTGRCFVTEHATTSLHIALLQGVSCTGIVRDARGVPVAGAIVATGSRSAFTLSRTETAPDGTFTLSGLAPGEIEVRARHDQHGKATARVRGEAGATVECALALSRGVELRGRVLDDIGAPIAEAYVSCAAPGSAGSASAGRTDAEGRFVLANCPDGALLTVFASLAEQQTQIDNVDPRRGEIELRLRRPPPEPARSVRITGRVAGPDGRPVAGAHVHVYGPRGERGGDGMTGDDGTFAVGPMRPGAWGLFVRSTRFPSAPVAMRECAPDAVWDVGLVQLVAGGTGFVQVERSPAGAELSFSIRNGAGRAFAAQWLGDRLLRTDVLAPGDYRVDLQGDGCAATSVPFTIRAGEETRVQVALAAGVRQQFEFARADGARASGDLVRWIRRGGEPLIDRSFAHWTRAPVHAPDGALTDALWLAPGRYRIDAEDDGVAGSAEFTVGEREGPPVRVTLR